MNDDGVALGILPNLFAGSESLISENKIIKFVSKDKDNLIQVVNFLDDNGNVLFRTSEFHYAKIVYQSLFKKTGFKDFKFIDFNSNETKVIGNDNIKLYGILCICK